MEEKTEDETESENEKIEFGMNAEVNVETEPVTGA